MEKVIKYSKMKTREELKTRIVDGKLSVGCYWQNIRKYVAEKPFPGSQKITVIYSPGYGGTAEIKRYI